VPKAPLSDSKTPENSKFPPHHKKVALLQKEIWFDDSKNQKPFLSPNKKQLKKE